VTPGPTTSARRRRLYIDTSAYLSILLAEDGSGRLSEETAAAELLSSVLLVLEAKRNLIRLAREGSLKPEQFQACMNRLDEDRQVLVLRDLTLDLCESNVVPAVATPRSLDLAHIRTALWFHAVESIDRFVTTDQSQRDAAKELGLPV
jgi:predicted nucleic acid-binding protein